MIYILFCELKTKFSVLQFFIAIVYIFFLEIMWFSTLFIALFMGTVAAIFSSQIENYIRSRIRQNTKILCKKRWIKTIIVIDRVKTLIWCFKISYFSHQSNVFHNKGFVILLPIGQYKKKIVEKNLKKISLIPLRETVSFSFFDR